jgi:hypothetical protein
VSILAFYLVFYRRRKSVGVKASIEYAGMAELSNEERKPYQADSQQTYEADSQQTYEAGPGERTTHSSVAELPGHQASLSRSRPAILAAQTADSNMGSNELPPIGDRTRWEANNENLFEAGTNTVERDQAHSNGSETETVIPQGTESPTRSTQFVHETASTQALLPAVNTESSKLVSPAPRQVNSSHTDTELERLHQEMAFIQEERAREERLRALNSREIELRRAIEERARSERVP